MEKEYKDLKELLTKEGLKKIKGYIVFGVLVFLLLFWISFDLYSSNLGSSIDDPPYIKVDYGISYQIAVIGMGLMLGLSIVIIGFLYSDEENDIE